jgi:hypothetical protein
MLSELSTNTKMVAANGELNQAVLSWRWDLGGGKGGSRNIATGLACAAEIGVDYLFVDVVLVDQALEGPALIRGVADFTGLFRRIRTIATYDLPDPVMDKRHFSRIIRRPWIAHGIRTMRFVSLR